MYTIMIIRPKWRTYVAAITAVIFAAAGISPLAGIPSAIDWNVLMMISGTMVVVDFFIASKMPNKIADYLLDKAPNVMWVTIFMSLFAGIISAFIDNVATVLMVAPVGMAVCKKLKINPVPMILSIAVSSNLQGAATLVGDTTSIMLGAYAKMDFTSFFWMNGKPGIFFAVELGALATIPVMMLVFRKEQQPVSADVFTTVEDYFPTVMLLAVVVTLIIASFIPGKPDITNGVICCIIALICIIRNAVHYQSFQDSAHALKSVDLQTIILLASLFIVIAGIRNVGIIDDVANGIADVGGNNLFLHMICPLLAVVSFIFDCGGEKRLDPRLTPAGVLPTLIYGAVYFIMVIVVGRENGGWADFYGFNMGGRWYVSVAVMLAATYAAALALWALQRAYLRRRR